MAWIDNGQRLRDRLKHPFRIPGGHPDVGVIVLPFLLAGPVVMLFVTLVGKQFKTLGAVDD